MLSVQQSGALYVRLKRPSLATPACLSYLGKQAAECKRCRLIASKPQCSG